MPRTILSRLGAVAALAIVIVLVLAGPASAHVTVNPSEAPKGGFVKLTFRVPNEKDNATTTKLEVALPADKPLASVSVKPVAGWTIATTKGKLATPVKTDDGEVTEAVTRIVWTAATPAAAIQPGQFQEFDISVGPLPDDADSLEFKALQTYSDGEIVRWIDESSGSEEPEHPAPVVKLTAASTTDDHGTSGSDHSAAASSDSTKDNGPSGLAVGALIAGLAGLVLAAFALGRTFRRG